MHIFTDTARVQLLKKIADILKEYYPCCVVGTDERTRAEKHTYYLKPGTTYVKISTIHKENLKR